MVTAIVDVYIFNGHQALAFLVLHKDLARLTLELTSEQAI